MARNESTGIKQLPNKMWSCRIYKKINGKQIDSTYKIDSRTGKPFAKKSEAIDFRRWKIQELENPTPTENKFTNITFGELWDLYVNSNLAKEKAPNTVVKHTSVWENHIKAVFGQKYINGDNAVSVHEINNFLRDKYYNTELSYHYIESFLKVFYLLYGLAYNANYINAETLNRFTKISNTRIAMPPMTAEDRDEDDRVETYTPQQIDAMAKIFKGTDLEPAFLIAYYCALRESEVMGLMWEDIDFIEKKITINKQLVYNKSLGVWCITPVKTLKSNRVVDMPKRLDEYLYERYKQNLSLSRTDAYKSRASEIVYDTRGRETVQITGANFVNRKLANGHTGELITTNSIKYYAKKIKEECGFQLKMHKLRKTNLSYLAENGAPFKYLMEHAGHKKVETTLKYYIKVGEDSTAKGRELLDKMRVDDPMVEVSIEDAPDILKGRTISIPLSEYKKWQEKLNKDPDE